MTGESASARVRLGACVGALLVTGISSFAIWRFFGEPTTGVDDANITLVYARNLANGYGFVFTPGFERVEGFTSLLWTLVCAAAFLLSGHPEGLLGVACLLLSAFCAVATAALAQHAVAVEPVAREGTLAGDAAPSAAKADERAWALVAGVAAIGWLSSIPAFHAWMTAPLMDVTLFAAGVHGFAWAIAVELRAAGRGRTAGGAQLALCGFAAALALTRPEALALVPAALMFGALAHHLGGMPARQTARRLAAPAAVFAATAIALTLFRLTYFGYPLPNTYYAKVSPDRLYAARGGLEYVMAWWRAQPLAFALGLAALATLGAAAWQGRSWALGPGMRTGTAVAGLALGGLVLPLFGGGDHFGSFRFLQPFAPLWIVPPLALLAALARRASFRPSALLIGVLVVAFGGASWAAAVRFRESHYLGHEFQAAFASRALGESLGRAFPGEPRPTVGSVVAGGLAYSYPGRVVDLMGLNWLAMGHSAGARKGSRNHAAFDPDVFWQEPPDIVTPRFLRGRTDGCAFESEFENRVLRGVQDSERFEREYAAAYVDLGNQVVGGYVRRAWAERAQPLGLVFFRGRNAHCDTDWSRDPARRRTLERGWRPLWQQ